jgi:Ca2+-binding EF-hand superfamily protein
MRLAKFAAFFVGVGLVLVYDPDHSPGQFGKGGPPGGGGATPGGGGGFGGKGGGFGGPPDPAKMWGYISRGKDSVDLNDPANSRLKARMEQEGRPIPPGGILTKEMYIADAERRIAAGTFGTPGAPAFGAPAGGAPGTVTFSVAPGGPVPGGPPTPGGPPSFVPMGGGGPPMGGGRGGGNDSPEERAAQRIREQDKNGDGKVSFEEADGRLRENFQRIDANGDGSVDAAEYAAYYASRGGPGGGRGPGGDPNGGGPGWAGGYGPNGERPGEKKETEEPKPVAMRYGHLPKDLPEWFDKHDTNKDGQVQMHEWRLAKEDLAKFVEMDLNKDGLVTADEFLRFGRNKAEDERIAALNDPDGAVRPAVAVKSGRGGPGGGISLPGSTPASTSDSKAGPGRGPSSDKGSSDKASSDKNGGEKGKNPFRPEGGGKDKKKN